MSKNQEELEILIPCTIDEEESQNITFYLNIPGIETKIHQSVVAQKALTLENPKYLLPIRALDSCLLRQGAVRNGGVGVYTRYQDGTTKSLSAPTGQLSTNYRSEQQAATQAMSHLIKQAVSNTNIVFLIDCTSVLQSIQNESQDNVTRNLKHQFIIVCRTNNAALQWIPSQCGIGRKRVCRQTSQTSI